MNSKFISCLRFMNPAMEIKISPQARPNVSTNVARRPELRVPEAKAVGITLLSADPMIPSKHWMGEYVKKYPITYRVGDTAKT